MRNFYKLCSGLDVSSLLHSLAVQPQLWGQYGVRQYHAQSVHKAVEDILLRYNPFNDGDDFVDSVCSNITCVNYPAWSKLPAAHPFIFGLMQRVQGLHLGRCMISRLVPGAAILLHSDRIAPAEEAFPERIPPAVYYERYQLPLQSNPGCLFRCGDEQVEMQAGDAWWFDNQQPHEVINNSDSDRISLIVDIRTSWDDYIPH